ncbi:GGDEF domain-containing protein [uncultured Aquincola sp.]|uniref:GGDEF domain-containing protein n=1 Tax=uncultured Aquincola sp. TaxID=886556 RepID=UPI0032B2AB60|tara:strand:- start:964 stop:2037 length:1074 start_codon:yes stop_codon:yes gene_type:complete
MPHNKRLAEIGQSVGGWSLRDYRSYLGYAERSRRVSTLRVQALAFLSWLVASAFPPGTVALSVTTLVAFGAALMAGMTSTAVAPNFIAGAVSRVFFATVVATALAHVASHSPHELLWQLSICAIVVVAMSPVHYDPISYTTATLLINLSIVFPRLREILVHPEAAWMLCLTVAAVIFGITINYMQFSDRIKIHKINRRLAELAFKDALTQINNRRAFVNELTRSLASGDPQELYLFLIDADDFKTVNDVHGHDVGDEVLQHIARQLTAAAGDAHCGRLGGEEFGMIYRGERDQAQHQAGALNEAISATPIQGVNVSVSIGIARYRHGMQLARLLKLADDALYRAKRAGKNRYHFAEE